MTASSAKAILMVQPVPPENYSFGNPAGAMPFLNTKQSSDPKAAATFSFSAPPNINFDFGNNPANNSSNKKRRAPIDDKEIDEEEYDEPPSFKRMRR